VASASLPRASVGNPQLALIRCSSVSPSIPLPAFSSAPFLRSATDRTFHLSRPPVPIHEPATDVSATNGVVLATEKKSPSLLLDTSVLEKVAPICPNIGFVYSGMGPDFRVLVAKARKIAQAYWKVYGEYPPTKVLVQEVANVMQKATQSG
jgi:hypothetical protein